MNIEGLFFHDILRDNQGRVRWHTPGNNPEQDLQQGIANMRGLWFTQFPATNCFLFDNNGLVKILPAKKSELEKVIIDEVGRVDQFNKVFGNGARSINYFRKSHRYALRISFEGLDLDLQFRKNAPMEGDIASIIERAGRFHRAYGSLKEDALKAQDPKLFADICTYYPGRITGIGQALEVKTKRPHGYWSDEKIHEIGIQLKQEHGLGNISKTDLVRLGYGGMYQVIRSGYPEGMAGFNRDIALLTSSASEANEYLRNLVYEEAK